MAGGVESTLGADQHVVSKGHAAGVQNDAAVVHVEVPAHTDIPAVVAPEGRLNPQSFPSGAQQPAQQHLGGFDALRLIGPLIELLALSLAGSQLRQQGLIMGGCVQHSPQHLLLFRHRVIPPVQAAPGPQFTLPLDRRRPPGARAAVGSAPGILAADALQLCDGAEAADFDVVPRVPVDDFVAVLIPKALTADLL